MDEKILYNVLKKEQPLILKKDSYIPVSDGIYPDNLSVAINYVDINPAPLIINLHSLGYCYN